MKKYILLDWDGNLAKTLDIWLNAIRAVVESQGIHKTDEEIGSSFGQFTKYLNVWGVKDVDKALEDADIIAKEKLPSVDLYPDALYVLEELHKQGRKLALITTSPHGNVRHLLEKHGLTELFDQTITWEDTQNHKPHPEPLELALKRFGGSKEEAVMIGDSDKDLSAANNAGIESILFFPPEHDKFYNFDDLNSLNPTYIVREFIEILDLV